MAHPDITSLLPAVRANLKESDCLSPCFFIESGDEMLIAAADFSTDEAKNHAAREVRRLVKATGANSVMLLAESYIRSVEDGECHRGLAKRGLAADPKAKEVVIFNYETASETWMGVAPILPGRELGALEWKQMPMGAGRFSGFFDHEKVRH